MSFAFQAQNVTLAQNSNGQNTILKANCPDGKGGNPLSELDLNNYIANIDGQLIWGRTGFGYTSSNIRLDSVSPDHVILRADCWNLSGVKIDQQIDLNIYIPNYNGQMKPGDLPQTINNSRTSVQQISLLPTKVLVDVGQDHNPGSGDNVQLRTELAIDGSKLLPDTSAQTVFTAGQTGYSPSACILDLSDPKQSLLQVDVNAAVDYSKLFYLSLNLGATHVTSSVGITVNGLLRFNIAIKRDYSGPFRIAGLFPIGLSGDQFPNNYLPLGNVPLELYILPRPLPTTLLPASLPDGLPLLLLRLFVTPASTPNGIGTEKWVELVTRIAHGSVSPDVSPWDGQTLQSTASHWLKYETVSGNRSFIGSGWADPDYPFRLNPWLDAYRNFKQNNVYTTVNCFDQAGIVNVALSLGMDYHQVFWEYHELYGFISDTAQLVGWGPCNNPYFKNNTDNMILKDPLDKSRSRFRSHAHLSWSPKLKPKFTTQDAINQASNVKYPVPDPKWMDRWTATESLAPALTPAGQDDGTMRIIDACAGPHVGNEDRTTYNNKKDPNHRPPTEDETRPIPRHFLTEGVTNLSSNPLTDKPSTVNSLTPTEYTGIAQNVAQFTPPSLITGTNTPNPAAQNFFPGTVSPVRDSFQATLNTMVQTQTAPVPIRDVKNLIKQPDGTIVYESYQIEAKSYIDARPTTNSYSLKITVCLDFNSALAHFQDRLQFIELFSPDSLTLSQQGQDKLKIITQPGFAGFVYTNLMVEVRVDDPAQISNVDTIAFQVGQTLLQSTGIGPNWNNCLGNIDTTKAFTVIR